MKFHEYQSKGIFNEFGIPVPNGYVISNAAQAKQISNKINGVVVLKAQVLSRGREKYGGIRLIRAKDEIDNIAAEILGLTIDGYNVHKILIEEAVNIMREYSLSLYIDYARETPVLQIFQIEKNKKVGQESPNRLNFLNIDIDVFFGPFDFQIRSAALFLEIEQKHWDSFSQIVKGVWNIFTNLDVVVLEINPLVISMEGKLLALDARIEVDDYALSCHPEISEMYDPMWEDPKEIEANKYDIRFYGKGGKIGCVVNGKGLSAALSDMIYSATQQTATIIDIGGEAGTENVSAALKILIEDQTIEVILVVVFGGITKCNEIVDGLNFVSGLNTKALPIIVYMNGTNHDSALLKLNENDLIIAESLKDAAKKAAARLITG